jgi:cytochrome c553
MKILPLGVSVLAIAVATAALAAPLSKTARSTEPFWAWGFSNLDGEKLAAAPPKVDPSTAHTLGTVTMTRAQQQAAPGPVDWYPQDHAGIATPDIVAFGSKTPRPDPLDSGKMVTITACSLCHLPNGFGRAENANIAGLPVDYFKEQINELKSGVRNTSDPNKTNEAQMISFAQTLTDAEIQQAAEYFAKFTFVPPKSSPNWITVQEVSRLPKFDGNGSWSVFTDPNNYTTNGVVFVKDTGNNYVDLGNRIMETPRVPEDQDVWRDPHSSFMAYVPVGSLAKGKGLVETGDNGRILACSGCHGAQLQGNGTNIPPLAGRSPSYIARQLYDMSSGERVGTWTSVMATVVTALTPDDIVNVSAYIASMQPTPPIGSVAAATASPASPQKVQ